MSEIWQDGDKRDAKADQPAEIQPATQPAPGPATPPEPDPQLRRDSRKAMIKYGAARVGLFVVLTVIIHLLAVLFDAPVPLIFSALLALFVALPLSMLIFTKWRVEATESIAEYSRQRKERKAWIEKELAGR